MNESELTPEIIDELTTAYEANKVAFEMQDFELQYSTEYEFIRLIMEHFPVLIQHIQKMEKKLARAIQDRYDALSVTSKEGLLSSEWVARTGKAEREANSLRTRVSELEKELEEWRSGQRESVIAKYKELDPPE